MSLSNGMSLQVLENEVLDERLLEMSKLQKALAEADAKCSLLRERTARAEAKSEMMELQFQRIKMGSFELTPEDESIVFSLNFDLAQCKSKTDKCLQIIALLHKINKQKYSYPTAGKPVKLVSIVFTNNSLLETKAWKDRTAAKFCDGDIVVQRLASDVEKKSGDFSKGKELLGSFCSYAGDKYNTDIIGDVIVMCNHPRRILDMMKVIRTMSELHSSLGVKFKFNIYFDECDDGMCLTNMIKFTRHMYDNHLTQYIDEVQLITATPTVEMHKRLKDITSDADKLLNIDKRIPKEDDIRVIDYSTILNQHYKPVEGPKDPVEYVKHLYSNNPEIFQPGKIYFIPSGHYVSQHNEMANLDIWDNMGTWRLVLNGKEKGFRDPLGGRHPLNLKKDGELRDLLREWRDEHPTAGLVITGSQVLRRGLTFLTDGFCFDYMIVSSYFARDIMALIQMLGRGQGKAKFVGKFEVLMPQALYDVAKRHISDAERILSENPNFYDSDILGSIGKVDTFANINTHCEVTVENLSGWVNNNLKQKSGKYARISLNTWNTKPRNEDGFIMHKFGGTKENPSEEKVWSEEEALKQRGGMASYTRRIFPCYTDTNDVTTLKWYVFYRNDE